MTITIEDYDAWNNVFQFSEYEMPYSLDGLRAELDSAPSTAHLDIGCYRVYRLEDDPTGDIVRRSDYYGIVIVA